MIQKAQEFRTMTQGTMRVEEYAQHFTKMMRYAPDDVTTEKKKVLWFLHGLHRGLRQILMGSVNRSLHILMDTTIAFEREKLDLEDSLRTKKRRVEALHHNRQSQKPRFGQNNQSSGGFRLGQGQGNRSFGGHSSGGQVFDHGSSSYSGARNNSYSGQKQSAPRFGTGGFQDTCFACNKIGHKSFECPEKKDTPTRAPGCSVKGTPAWTRSQPQEVRGHLNHVIEEDAKEATDVVLGEYLVNGVPALFLFDSGATKSFVSSKFAK